MGHRRFEDDEVLFFYTESAGFGGGCVCPSSGDYPPVDWGEISMKQSVGKCKQINF